MATMSDAHKAEFERIWYSLRLSYQKIHFFGLGFVQVKISEEERWHFYHPSLPSFTENPHDHRYHFTSTVHRGVLESRIWKISPGDKLNAVVRYESCTHGVQAPSTATAVDAELVSSFQVYAGSSYYLDENTFHQVSRIGQLPCITHLRRGKKVKEFASVIGFDGSKDLCPFSAPMSNSDCWTAVSECLFGYGPGL